MPYQCITVEYLLFTGCKSISLVQTTCHTSKVIVVEKGDNTMWRCDIRALPGSTLSVMHNKTLLSPLDQAGKGNTEALCDKDPHAFYQIEEDKKDACYSLFTVSVVVCSVEEGIQGDYSIVWGDQNISEGNTVTVKFSHPPIDDSGIHSICLLHTIMYTILSKFTCSFTLAAE